MKKRQLPNRKRVKGICTYCKGPVKAPRRYWCSKDCVHEWNIRRSSSYARKQVLKRDKGICALCGHNCLAEERKLKYLRHLAWVHRNTAEYRTHCDAYWAYAATQNIPAPKPGLEYDTKALYSWRRSLWDTDHILSVVEGGGGCGLENLQTLCRPCHAAKTAELAKRRAQAKRKKKVK